MCRPSIIEPCLKCIYLSVVFYISGSLQPSTSLDTLYYRFWYDTKSSDTSGGYIILYTVLNDYTAVAVSDKTIRVTKFLFSWPNKRNTPQLLIFYKRFNLTKICLSKIFWSIYLSIYQCNGTLHLTSMPVCTYICTFPSFFAHNVETASGGNDQLIQCVSIWRSS